MSKHDYIEPRISYINSSVARQIDEALMNQPGFSIDQLMELAGLAVAQSTHFYITETFLEPQDINILILCGPGNNGGDGLVAARHLKHFGFHPTICYPKPGKSQLFLNLVKQCQDLSIPFISHNDITYSNSNSNNNNSNSSINTCSNNDNNNNNTDNNNNNNNNNIKASTNQYNLIIDSLFGFSFDGPPREPFSNLIQLMINSKLPVLSVDIPSGWHVEQGDVYETGFYPSAVISLTLPKICMKHYKGFHLIGGRFIPPTIINQFNLTIPEYGFNCDQFQLLHYGGKKDQR